MRSPLLDAAAASIGAATRQVALAWLLQRSPNILVIVGALSVEHFRDNLKATALEFSPDTINDRMRASTKMARTQSAASDGDLKERDNRNRTPATSPQRPPIAPGAPQTAS
ncbi:aldo/keto reductase [Methylocystis hirsuta]|uniref:aldo/keto reductase n=1 Tax=Methylocystis hirsuta TaxID=369798 RepID=UPI002478E59A|nr:aldo/keto reductase [Methylocystis hirsuta]